MSIRYYLTSLLLVVLLTCCVRRSINTADRQLNKKPTSIASTGDAVDDHFSDFIEKFSTDSVFQLSRTIFPLKVKWYDIDNDRDSVIYKETSNFEMMDFRKNKSTGRYDQWEQKIVVDKANTSAIIEIRGIDNGIMVDYRFKKINKAWMLTEIDDSST